MAWSQISGTFIQYGEDDVDASSYYLKFYAAGTTTPIVMATDSTGATTLDKCQLDTDGMPINGSGGDLIPHIDQKYKLVIYRNSTDADANTFANAYKEIDDIEQVITSIAAAPVPVATIAEMTANTTAAIGDYYQCADYAEGHYAGTLIFEMVAAGTGTADGGSYFDHDTLPLQCKRIFNQRISVKDFGAAGNGVVDDTAEMQAAIDYCLDLTLPTVKGSSKVPKLVFPGTHYLTTSLKIDRPTNQNGNFIIEGGGNGSGGLVIDTDIFIIDSNYSGFSGTGEASNQIIFRGLNFVSDAATVDRIAFNMDKFVRYSITDCSFIGIRAGYSASYIQSCRVDRCTIRGTNGSPFKAVTNWYDGGITNTMFEANNQPILDIAGIAYGMHFTDNLVQSNYGTSCLSIGEAKGVDISSNYVEANHGRFLSLATARGISVTDNYINTRTSAPNNELDPNFFEFDIGESYSATVTDNDCTYQALRITGTNKYCEALRNGSTSPMPQTKSTTTVMSMQTVLRGRTYEFISGSNTTITQIDIDLGGAGNTSVTVMVEVLVAGYNGRVVDYVFARNSTNTSTFNPRSTSSVVPTLVSGSGEQTVLRVTDTITHPVVKVKVTIGGSTFDSSLDVNPSITFS